MRFLETFIKKPVLAIAIGAAIVMLGFIGFHRLPIRQPEPCISQRMGLIAWSQSRLGFPQQYPRSSYRRCPALFQAFQSHT